MLSYIGKRTRAENYEDASPAKASLPKSEQTEIGLTPSLLASRNIKLQQKQQNVK